MLEGSGKARAECWGPDPLGFFCTRPCWRRASSRRGLHLTTAPHCLQRAPVRSVTPARAAPSAPPPAHGEDGVGCEAAAARTSSCSRATWSRNAVPRDPLLVLSFSSHGAPPDLPNTAQQPTRRLLPALCLFLSLSSSTFILPLLQNQNILETLHSVLAYYSQTLLSPCFRMLPGSDQLPAPLMYNTIKPLTSL